MPSEFDRVDTEAEIDRVTSHPCTGHDDAVIAAAGLNHALRTDPVKNNVSDPLPAMTSSLEKHQRQRHSHHKG